MSFSAIFIARPVATTLLTLGVALAGIVSFFLLPVSPLPQVDFPTISVQASMAGASPETMATSVATPLERHLGQIADVTEMTSTSTVGSTRVILQFGLNRDIDGAARDVQAAINAARADLPVSLKSNPTYRKMNPADAPIMIIALSSKTLTQGQIYDAASTVLQQKLSQVEGIGQVVVGGSSLPAVRVELNPRALAKYALGPEDVRAGLAAANANTPKGTIDVGEQRYQIYTNDQARTAADYQSLIVAYRDGSAVHLSDVAEVVDSVEDLRNQGLFNGQRSVALILFRQPGANIIDVVDRVHALVPALRASVSSAIELEVAMDRTTTIRGSLRDVERTLVISIILVILVVFLFLGEVRATLIPSVAVPVSLIGTFGVMYLLGYSLDNLSLMALTVGTGFVVDDAIVVLENVTRHLEAGMPRLQAALQGTREVSFTVLSMSLSLIAVFIPILLMGGIVGRMFHEFAMTLSVAILVSLLVSLTTTPMMCARLLRPVTGERRPLWPARVSARGLAAVIGLYRRSLAGALAHPLLVMLILLATIGLNVELYISIPKGFFPEQDTGQMIGGVMADQSISFQAMRKKMTRFQQILLQDPALNTVIGYTGGSQTNTGFMYATLKPLSERKISVGQVIARLRDKLSVVAGASMFLIPVQDIRVGGRPGNGLYQFTLQADDLAALRSWAPKLTEALRHVDGVVDANSDQQDGGQEIDLTIDRDTASRLGLTASQIDNTLYDSYGQRQVSTIYNAANQYHVIMEVGQQYWQDPNTLDQLFVSTSGGSVSGSSATNAVSGTTSSRTSSTSGTTTATTSSGSTTAANTAKNQQSNQLGTIARNSASTGSAISTKTETMVPLSAFARFTPGSTPLGVNHQGHFAAATISFNLPVGGSLSDAVAAIQATMNRIGVPATVHGSFQGAAATFQASLNNQGLLILAALGAVYIVLGILYESYVHPITILSTLPSAGVGAVLALLVCNTEFSLIALIGVILLIGIVKKNAIMMIDFAIDAQRTRGLTPRDAIFQACVMRFRPIMMTTMVAMLGALPMAIGTGDGAEMRRPLGIAIIGGLLVSQMLTLYTTPIIYLYLERLRLWTRRLRQRGSAVDFGQVTGAGE
ncbi:MAG: efflux RND transporter permease subunit [Azospirillaceae bacterium]|nr:efflux RND transporter permease subunit [Azospirillaceae bacterium]